MPHRSLHPCATHGCRELTYGARCPEHAKAHQAIYRTIRPDDSMYQTQLWRGLRREMLDAYPQCARCGAPATEVDHITPIRDGGTFDDPRNLQSLCKGCHSAKTVQETMRRG